MANTYSDDVTILLGNGAGDFTEAPGSTERTGVGPSAVAVGDFDGDGDLDLAVTNQVSDDVTILLGNGAGDFTEAARSPERVRRKQAACRARGRTRAMHSRGMGRC